MSSSGEIRHKAVWAMLEECAPGYSKLTAPRRHYWTIQYNGKTYPGFPLGTRKSKHPTVQVGHIKKMARHFGILECAKSVLQQLK